MAAALIVLVAAAVAVAFVLRDWREAKGLRVKRRTAASRQPIRYDLIARHGKTRFNLGPKDQVQHVRIGSSPDADIPLIVENGQKYDLSLINKSGRFRLHNRSPSPVTVNRAKVRPGMTREVRVPTTIQLEKGPKIALTLAPRRVPAPKQAEPKQQGDGANKVEETQHA
jgi:hypothetical protein